MYIVIYDKKHSVVILDYYRGITRLQLTQAHFFTYCKIFQVLSVLSNIVNFL